MTKIHIEYDIDNAAFDETPLPETKRIFAEIVDLIANGNDGGSIQDINGNTIGSWKIHDYTERYEETEIDRLNKHMDEILEVKARLLEENIEDYDANDIDQQAENDAIFEVFSKYYSDIPWPE